MAIVAAHADGLDHCLSQLRQGRPVAIPTETVYGLAADATNGTAIAALYALKNRPQFNPLICHVADIETAHQLGQFNADAEKLAAAFWPGPLTLVVPRAPNCPIDPLASAGLDSLAIRLPAHPIARDILRQFDGALVAPSANPSGRLSPTNAAHVAALLPEIDVLDGGDCSIGLESSIIGCLDDTPLWLRAGGLARKDIETALGKPLTNPPSDIDATAKLAPGRLARHYAPQNKLRLNATDTHENELLIGFGTNAPENCVANLSPTAALGEAAANLFTLLHRLDSEATAQGKSLAIMAIPTHGLGEAINDRLTRAARG